MQTMIATDVFPYAKESLRVGDQFEAEEGHVDFLEKAGRAKRPAPTTTDTEEQSQPPTTAGALDAIEQSAVGQRRTPGRRAGTKA